MSPFEDYFEKIFCINMDKSTDRWGRCLQLFDLLGWKNVERFSGYDLGELGNYGCTASHRAIFELTAYHKWCSVFILEDDFDLLNPNVDVDAMFRRIIYQVPPDWDMLYLGGHYGAPPQCRVSKNVIRISRMLTTSSYAITHTFARTAACSLSGGVAPDSALFGYHLSHKCYISQPRLFVQRSGYSYIQQRDMDNTGCMTDTNHENMV